MKEGVEGNEVGARAEGKPSRKARRYMYTRDKGKSGRKMESEGKLVGSVKMQRVSSERTRERDGKIKTRAYRAGAETPQSRKVPPSSAHTPASEHRYRVYSICMYTGRAGCANVTDGVAMCVNNVSERRRCKQKTKEGKKEAVKNEIAEMGPSAKER